jgi:hypothetical protein
MCIDDEIDISAAEPGDRCLVTGNDFRNPVVDGKYPTVSNRHEYVAGPRTEQHIQPVADLFAANFRIREALSEDSRYGKYR